MNWNYWLFILLTLALTAFIGYGTYRTARLLQIWQPKRNLLLLPAENLVRVVLLGLCIALGILSGLDPSQLGWHMRLARMQSLVGILTGLAMALTFYHVTRFIIRRTGERFYSSLLLNYIVPTTTHEFMLVLLALIPVVILEELLFRSLLLGGLAPLFSPWVLVLGFGILFGLFHSPQGTWGMAGAGLGGVIFGGLFLWQGSLLAPIIAHYVANAVQIKLAMVHRYGETDST